MTLAGFRHGLGAMVFRIWILLEKKGGSPILRLRDCMKDKVLNLIQRCFKCRIYRNSLPRGTDFFADIQRHFGAHNVRTVFDVGANVGQSAEEYARAFPNAKIYSFEPVTATFQQLIKNTAKLSQVRAFKVGFGDANSSAEIYVSELSVLSSIKNCSGTEKETVSIRRVDDFASENSISEIDFMKIDTEGYECEVLRGAQGMLNAQRVKILYIESAPDQADARFVPFAELMALMNAFGYKLFGIYGQQPCWNGDRNIYYFNSVFISEALVRGSLNP